MTGAGHFWTHAAAIHLWGATLFGLAMGALLVFLPGPARVRHFAGWLALLRFALPLGLLASMAGLPEWISASNGFLRPGGLGGWWMPAFVVSGRAASAHFPVAMLLALAWAVGAVLVFTVGWIRRRRGLRVIERGQTPFSESDRRRLDGLAARADLRPGRVRGAYVSSCAWMGVVGLWHPRVLVPRGLLATLNSTETESVLLHELVHVRRRDNLLRLVQAGIVAAFWFHPLVWWLDRRLRWESERACDEAVLGLTEANQAYASGILKAARYALGLDLPGISAMSRMRLKTRIGAVLHHQNRKESSMKTALTVSALIGLFGLTTLFAASPGTSARPAAKTAPTAKAIQVSKTIVYDYGDLDERPVVVQQTRPLYPAKLHRSGQTGQVDLSFVVDREGNVTDLKVIKSTDKRFNAAALAAVSQWKFRPGRHGGRTVNTRMVAPIVFALKK